MTTVIARPSSLLGSIKVEKVDVSHLFKFNDERLVQLSLHNHEQYSSIFSKL